MLPVVARLVATLCAALSLCSAWGTCPVMTPASALFSPEAEKTFPLVPDEVVTEQPKEQTLEPAEPGKNAAQAIDALKYEAPTLALPVPTIPFRLEDGNVWQVVTGSGLDVPELLKDRLCVETPKTIKLTAPPLPPSMRPYNEKAEVQSYQLPNCLVVHTVHLDSGEPSLSLTFPFGYAHDGDHPRGTAHLMEHTLVLGTKELSDQSEITQFRSGGHSHPNGMTGPTRTTLFWQPEDSAALVHLMDEAAQTIVRPKLEADFLLRETKLLEAEAEMDAQDLVKVEAYLFFRLSNRRLPYHTANAGSIRTLLEPILRKLKQAVDKEGRGPEGLDIDFAGKDPRQVVDGLTEWQKEVVGRQLEAEVRAMHAERYSADGAAAVLMSSMDSKLMLMSAEQTLGRIPRRAPLDARNATQELDEEAGRDKAEVVYDMRDNARVVRYHCAKSAQGARIRALLPVNFRDALSRRHFSLTAPCHVLRSLAFRRHAGSFSNRIHQLTNTTIPMLDIECMPMDQGHVTLFTFRSTPDAGGDDFDRNQLYEMLKHFFSFVKKLKHSHVPLHLFDEFQRERELQWRFRLGGLRAFPDLFLPHVDPLADSTLLTSVWEDSHIMQRPVVDFHGKRSIWKDFRKKVEEPSADSPHAPTEVEDVAAQRRAEFARQPRELMDEGGRVMPAGGEVQKEALSAVGVDVVAAFHQYLESLIPENLLLFMPNGTEIPPDKQEVEPFMGTIYEVQPISAERMSQLKNVEPLDIYFAPPNHWLTSDGEAGSGGGARRFHRYRPSEGEKGWEVHFSPKPSADDPSVRVELKVSTNEMVPETIRTRKALAILNIALKAGSWLANGPHSAELALARQAGYVVEHVEVGSREVKFSFSGFREKISLFLEMVLASFRTANIGDPLFHLAREYNRTSVGMAVDQARQNLYTALDLSVVTRRMMLGFLEIYKVSKMGDKIPHTLDTIQTMLTEGSMQGRRRSGTSLLQGLREWLSPVRLFGHAEVSISANFPSRDQVNDIVKVFKEKFKFASPRPPAHADAAAAAEGTALVIPRTGSLTIVAPSERLDGAYGLSMGFQICRHPKLMSGKLVALGELVSSIMAGRLMERRNALGVAYALDSHWRHVPGRCGLLSFEVHSDSHSLTELRSVVNKELIEVARTTFSKITEKEIRAIVKREKKSSPSVHDLRTFWDDYVHPKGPMRRAFFSEVYPIEEWRKLHSTIRWMSVGFSSDRGHVLCVTGEFCRRVLERQKPDEPLR